MSQQTHDRTSIFVPVVGASEAVEQVAADEVANGPMVSSNGAAQGVAQHGVGVGGRRQKPNPAASISRRITVNRANLTMSTTIFEVEDNINEATPDLEAGEGPIAYLVPEGASKEHLVRGLLMLSYASLFVGVNVGLHLPAATGSLFVSHQAAYYSVIATILTAGPIEMTTAIWLRRSNDRHFHTFAEVLWHFGIVLLVMSVLGGIEFIVKV